MMTDHSMKTVARQFKNGNYDAIRQALYEFMPGIYIDSCHLDTYYIDRHREHRCVVHTGANNCRTFINITFVILESRKTTRHPYSYKLDKITCHVIYNGNCMCFSRKFRPPVVKTIDGGLARAGSKLRKWYTEACGILLLEKIDRMT